MLTKILNPCIAELFPAKKLNEYGIAPATSSSYDLTAASLNCHYEMNNNFSVSASGAIESDANIYDYKIEISITKRSKE